MPLHENLDPVMGTYGRFPVTLTRGKGSEVFDDQGRRYLDFLGGISVNALGHAPQEVAEALHHQVDTLWHVSNLYHIEPQRELAKLLVENSCFHQAFFCNSGTEANEAALKLSRIACVKEGKGERSVTVAMKKSFHGRSYGALSVTGQEAYQAPFRPLLPEVRFAEFGDIESLKACLDSKVAAVILEPLQAEGGLNSPPAGYLKAVKELCNQNGSFLIFDEVQVGMGRLGQLFAYQHYGVEPDIISLAKALGGGFPIGAMLAKGHLSRHFTPGTHASTFGGNPLATATARAVVKTLLKPGFLESSRERSAALKQGLESIVAQNKAILGVKGEGMLMGLQFEKPVAPLVKACLDEGLLVGSAGGTVLRLAPALNLSVEHLAEGLKLLQHCINNTSL
jgi:acetylornithine/N-succinyldiaminopimelate aminotransferase